MYQVRFRFSVASESGRQAHGHPIIIMIIMIVMITIIIIIIVITIVIVILNMTYPNICQDLSRLQICRVIQCWLHFPHRLGSCILHCCMCKQYRQLQKMWRWQNMEITLHYHKALSYFKSYVCIAWTNKWNWALIHLKKIFHIQNKWTVCYPAWQS